MTGRLIRYALVVIVLTAVIAALIGCADYARDRLYAPGEGAPAVPEWTGAAPETMSVTTRDGLSLAGYYWPPAEQEGDIVLVLHGRRDNHARMAGYVQRLAETGRGVLVASYRGFNDNPGEPSEAGLIEDARAFYRFARAQTDGEVYVFGHSLGGAVAIQLAARETLDGLITLGTFTDTDEAAPYYAEWFIPDKWRSIKAIAEVEEPALILHGAEDDLITPDQSEALYAAICSPAALVIVDGVRHRPNFRLIGPLITGWIHALEQDAVAEMQVTVAARWESKMACGAG